MRLSQSLVVGLGLSAALSPSPVAAQSAIAPTIHHVTVRSDTGVLTIAGSGLGADLTVTLDGQPATVMPGASDAQLDVVAPASVLSTPGTYRLVVADAARQRGDGFIVAVPTSAGTSGREVQDQRGTSAARIPTVRTSSDLASRPRAASPSVDPHLTENTCGTAVGFGALASNLTKFCGNTAIGRDAVALTTTGLSNTGVGAQALRSNTTGSFNTALGVNAGLDATDGSHNVYVGADVVGVAAEANTMRLGLPFTGSSGQTRTFIAGIHGTPLTGPAVPVFVDAAGQLGTLTAPIATGTIDDTLGSAPRPEAESSTVGALRRQVERLQSADAELRRRIAALEAQLQALAARPRR
jgi:hypothetical protein